MPFFTKKPRVEQTSQIVKKANSMGDASESESNSDEVGPLNIKLLDYNCA